MITKSYRYDCSMKFVFGLSGHYPTQKAYGVTTTGTIQALKAQKHDILMVSRCETEHYVQQHWHFGKSIVLTFNKLLSNRATSTLVFPIWQWLYSCIFLKLVPVTDQVVWLREPWVAFYLSRKKKYLIVCEIHHYPRKLNKLVFSRLQKEPSVVLAPIKEDMRTRLELRPVESPVVPMAVNRDFLSIGERRDSNRSLNGEIVVLGNLTNKYQRESFDNLLLQLKAFDDFGIPINVKFVGRGVKEIENKIEHRWKNAKFNFLGYVNNSEIPNLLKETDIGIIPYLENTYFEGTFPIKIVEYASTKNLILSTQTPCHTRLLSEKAVFYELNSIDSLGILLREILVNKMHVADKIENAFKWAQRHTYEARVSNVLVSLEKARNFS